MRYVLLPVSLLAAVALAQDPLNPPRPSPKHVEVPDPMEALEPEPAPAAAEPAPAQPDASTSGVGGRSPRREQREASGEPPQALSGRFHVVQITEGGETEDFRLKMDRAGKALHQDCITVAMVFDFGGAGGADLPKRVLLVERQECYKGGFGKYLNEMRVELPVAWSKKDGAVVMTLPEVRATSGLVRLRRPEGDDLRTPPQWLGPETEIDRTKTDYTVLAETGSRGRKAEGGPTAIHLTTGHQVLHLEPAGGAGPFGD